jgi:hypothetical protein
VVAYGIVTESVTLAGFVSGNVKVFNFDGGVELGRNFE